MSYRRRFNLDEVLREWAAEQVATSREQRDSRRSSEELAAATDGAEEDEVRPGRGHVILIVDLGVFADSVYCKSSQWIKHVDKGSIKHVDRKWNLSVNNGHQQDS